jgi:hypothetical protein
MTSINNIQNMKWEHVWEYPMVSSTTNVDNEMVWEWTPPKADDIVYHSYIPHLELPPPMWNPVNMFHMLEHLPSVNPPTIDLGVDTWIEKENRRVSLMENDRIIRKVLAAQETRESETRE